MTTPLEKVFRPTEYLGLTVQKPQIPDLARRAAEQNGCVEKPEFHISVLVASNAQVAWQAVEAQKDAAKIQQVIESIFNSYTWEYEETHEYFLHERTYAKSDLIAEGESDVPEHSRRSIVQKVQFPDLRGFYKKLNDMLKISLPMPVPHITLFAWSDHEPYKTRGIGICSAEEFERFTQQVLQA